MRNVLRSAEETRAQLNTLGSPHALLPGTMHAGCGAMRTSRVLVSAGLGRSFERIRPPLLASLPLCPWRQSTICIEKKTQHTACCSDRLSLRCFAHAWHACPCMMALAWLRWAHAAPDQGQSSHSTNNCSLALFQAAGMRALAVYHTVNPRG